MKILIFNGSPRKNGGTATLIKKLTNHLTGEITIIDSYHSNISPCIDCRYCWTNEKCAIKDEMQNIYQLIDEADAIIIASPIYFGEITGSLLGLMSRLQYYWTARNFRNTEPLSQKQRKGAVILVSGKGCIDAAMAMGNRLLRLMNAELIKTICFSGTDNIPTSVTVVPEEILSEIINLSINLTQVSKMETEQLARLYPIILSKYNPEWPQWFAEEKMNLERLIGIDNIVAIHHYGSTSVPGLLAKPTIDILLEVKHSTDIEKLKAALPSPEYICLCGSGLTIPTPPPHLMFLKGYMSDGFAERVYHIHVRYPGNHDELYFRDYLISHPETAAEYAMLKTKLHQYYEHDRDGYTKAKEGFVRSITEKARGI